MVRTFHPYVASKVVIGVVAFYGEEIFEVNFLNNISPFRPLKPKSSKLFK